MYVGMSQKHKTGPCKSSIYHLEHFTLMLVPQETSAYGDFQIFASTWRATDRKYSEFVIDDPIDVT